jgi:hypothetical protein
MLEQATAKSAMASLPAAGGLLGNLTANIRGQLNAAAGGATQPASPDKAAPAKVHELRFAGGSLQGGEDDIEKFIRGLEQAGLRTA